jgi:hypothetical protein
MKKRKASSSRRRGISRIDQPSKRTHGWFVRVGYHERRDGSYGPRHTKFFGDASHGGKGKALTAAEKFVASVSKGGRRRRTTAKAGKAKTRKRGRR